MSCRERMPGITIAVSFLALTCVPSCISIGVPHVEIAPGIEMPMLAFGSVADSFKKECTVQSAVEQWLRLGGRHIDAAWNYHTQPDVGRAIKASGVPRRDIFLTTKIPGPIGKQEVIELITNTSLPELAVDYIDLVLIHFPCEGKHQFPNKCGATGFEKRIATFDGLVELKKAGKIRAIGVSNYNEEQVGELISQARGPPAVNQVEWHLGYHDETLLQAMKASGTTLEAWASLAGPTTGNAGVSLSDPRLQEVARRYNASTAQVALRWSVHKGVVPVTATCNKDHALGDLKAFDFDLSEQDVKVLDAMHAQKLDIRPQTNPTHYGDPKTGCESDEQAVQVQGVAGNFCSPKCSSSNMCPSDKPSGDTATPQCALQTSGGGKYCALICTPSKFRLNGASGECGTGSCQSIQGAGLCTYASSGNVSPKVVAQIVQPQINPTHYGDPKTGCESDEKAVQVQGVAGDFCSPKCSSSNVCPSDKPSGDTATPQCALQTTGGGKYCALICTPSKFRLNGANSECGTGSCQSIQGAGLCTYAQTSDVSAIVETQLLPNSAVEGVHVLI